MDEFKFVLKCFVFSCLIFALSQIQFDNGQTIESHVHGFLVSSSTAKFVNESARGGVKLAKNVSKEISQYLGFNKEEALVKSRPIHAAVIRKTEKTFIDHDTIENEKIDSEEDIDLE